MRRHKLESWLSSSESVTSTRVQKCLDVLLSHKDDVFASYMVCLKEKFNKLVNTPTFIISFDIHIKKRAKVLKDFESILSVAFQLLFVRCVTTTLYLIIVI